MLSSFQNSNAFRCSCKANETQLLECSAKEETQLLFKGKGTRQITPKDVLRKMQGSLIKIFGG